MRLLRLDFGDELHRLDLHPLITVVEDLSPQQQYELFDAARQLARGAARTFRGMVEHGGSLIEVGRASDLRISEQRRCPYDVVLHIDDLRPSHGDEESLGLEAEIERCRQRAEVDAVHLEALRADLRPWLWAEVIQLRAGLESLVANGADPDHGGQRNSARIDSARIDSARIDSARIDAEEAGPGISADEWDRSMGLLDTDRPAESDGFTPMEPTAANGVGTDDGRLEAVKQALARVDECNRHVTSLDPNVENLLGRWHEFVDVREHHGDHLSVLEQQLEDARLRVERAEEALVQAEEDSKPTLLNRSDENRLESLAEQADHRGGWLRKSGLTPAEEQELNSLLAKVGMRSWTEYTMFRLAPQIAPEDQDALDGARLELTEAEKSLHQAEVAVGSDPVAMELEAEYNALRAEAMTYLGAVAPNDVGAGLLELTRSHDDPEWLAAVDMLGHLLLEEGIIEDQLVGDNPEQLVEWARLWVDSEQTGQATVSDELVPLENGTQLDGEMNVPTDDTYRVDVAGTELVVSGHGAAAAGPDSRFGVDIDDLRRNLVEAEQRLVRHRRALSQIQAAQSRAAVSADRLVRLTRLAEQVRGLHGVTAGEIVASIKPVVQQIRSELGYAVPVVVSGSLTHLSSTEMTRLMDEFEQLSEQVQIIVLAGRVEADDWVNDVGPTRALRSNGATRSLWSTLP